MGLFFCGQHISFLVINVLTDTFSRFGVFIMAFRRKISRSRSKRVFSKTAARSHKKNARSHNPMRGGYRI